MKKVISIILSVIMVLSVVPITASAETVSGKCGKNVTWEFDESAGTLTISGTGAMYDYSNYNSPTWKSYEDNIKTVVIEDGVTTIGSSAFDGYINLASVIFSDDVITIGAAAFQACVSITDITLPNSLTTIGTAAFNICTNIKCIVIPDSVTAISEMAFAQCDKLKCVTISKSVQTIDKAAFWNSRRMNDVYYLGTEEEWNEISIEKEDNERLLNANIHYEHSHSFTYTKKTVPTCTKNGYSTYTCVCGSNYVDDYIDALGHTEKELSAVAPTCTKTGLTSGVECSVCGETLTAQQKIPAIGHNYETVVTVPTCTDRGYTTYACSICGDIYADNYVDATGHSYESTVTVPTCTEKGYTTYTCSICNDTYIDNYMDAIGHKYNSVVTQPTCEQNGYTTCTCECGDSYIANIIPATGHADNDGDGYCDACPEVLDPTLQCGCNCHKSGISKFFFDFILFFQRIFGSNKECACGVTHY